jgi:hypothetical protein
MMYRLLTFFVCCILFFYQSSTEGAIPSAIIVGGDAKSNAADMAAAAKTVADEAQAAADKAQAEADITAATAEVAKAAAALAKESAAEAAASADLAVAEASATEAENKARLAETKAAEAQEKERIANEAVQRAVAAQKAAQAAADNAQAAVNRANKAAAAEARVASSAAAAQAVRVAALAAAINADKMEDMEGKIDAEAARADAMFEGPKAAATDSVDAAAAHADAAGEKAAAAADVAGEAIDAQNQAADEKNDAAEALAAAKVDAKEAQVVLKDAKTNVEEAKIATLDAKTALNEAHGALSEAKANMAELTKKEAVRNIEGFTVAGNFYSWKDNKGNSGYQFVQPYTFSYQANGVETSLHTSYIISQYNSAAGDNSSGRVSTWSDTDLSMSHTNKNKQYPVKYSLDINVPTGKATLNGKQKNAIMSDDLVENNTFGSGWNYSPGISVSHKIGKEDTWTLGTMYTFRGKATLDGDLPNSELAPGSEWVKSLQWQHIGQKWRLTGDLIHTSYGTTQQGGVDYVKEGNQLDTRLTYVRELPNNQSLLLYYWYANQHHDTPLAQQIAGTNLSGQYAGAMWSRPMGKNRTLRISFDAMKKSGDSYDVLTDSYFSSGYKYTGGIGYDVEVSPRQKFSLDIQSFYMRNNSSNNNGSDVGYHGFHYMLKYLYNF